MDEFQAGLKGEKKVSAQCLHFQTFISIRRNGTQAAEKGKKEPGRNFLNQMHVVKKRKKRFTEREKRGKKACSDFVFSRNKKTLEVVIFEHSIMFHFH